MEPGHVTRTSMRMRPTVSVSPSCHVIVTTPEALPVTVRVNRGTVAPSARPTTCTDDAAVRSTADPLDVHVMVRSGSRSPTLIIMRVLLLRYGR